MRLWSIKFAYLDSKGLVALWRESLLAKNVLLGKTIGYKNHPQLKRFKELADPISGINFYLSLIYKESKSRNYNFNKEKVDWSFKEIKINVTTGQLEYEFQHLLHKIEIRDPEKYKLLVKTECIDTESIFVPISGGVEDWEKF